MMAAAEVIVPSTEGTTEEKLADQQVAVGSGQDALAPNVILVPEDKPAEPVQGAYQTESVEPLQSGDERTDDEYADPEDRNLEEEYPDGRCFEEGEIESDNDLGEDGEVIGSLEVFQFATIVDEDENEEHELVPAGAIKLRKLANSKMRRCELCRRQFVSQHSLQNHMKTHEEDGTKVSCRYCRRVFPSREEYDEHVVSHNNECFFQCEECGKKFYSRDYLAQHAKSHEGRYKCPRCPMKFIYNERLRTHLKYHGIIRTGPRRIRDPNRKPRAPPIGKEQYRCDVCDKGYITLGAFKKHKFTSHQEDFKCDSCDKTFTNFAFLRQHIGKEHKTKSFMCQHCGKTFIHRWYFKRHELTHTSNAALTCRFCNATFAALGNYTRHFRVHTGEKPFVCSFCGKSFAENGTLRRHERTHTGVKPFACKLCDKAFAVSHAMKRHMRTHDLVKGFPCKLCSSAYYTQRSLERHMKQKHADLEEEAAVQLLTSVKTSIHDQIQAHHQQQQAQQQVGLHEAGVVHMEVPVSVAEQVALQVQQEEYPMDHQVVIQEAVIHTTEDQQAAGHIMNTNFMEGQMLQQIQLQDGRNVFASVYEQGAPGNWQAQVQTGNEVITSNAQPESDPNQLSDDLIRREFERRFGKQKHSPKKHRKKHRKHHQSSSSSSTSSPSSSESEMDPGRKHKSVPIY